MRRLLTAVLILVGSSSAAVAGRPYESETVEKKGLIRTKRPGGSIQVRAPLGTRYHNTKGFDEHPGRVNKRGDRSLFTVKAGTSIWNRNTSKVFHVLDPLD